MAQKRNGDRIPKAMMTILPAKIPKPTRIKAGHELLPWLLLTANLTETHESPTLNNAEAGGGAPLSAFFLSAFFFSCWGSFSG